jgi:hypothetical protein
MGLVGSGIESAEWLWTICLDHLVNGVEIGL